LPLQKSLGKNACGKAFSVEKPWEKTRPMTQAFFPLGKKPLEKGSAVALRSLFLQVQKSPGRAFS